MHAHAAKSISAMKDEAIIPTQVMFIPNSSFLPLQYLPLFIFELKVHMVVVWLQYVFGQIHFGIEETSN